MISLLGIPLALACAVATNIGFLFKHRGACAAPQVDMRRPVRSARLLFASRLFTIGMAIASMAWIFHVAALSVAPMSLVQSVLAGGMVLLAVMAERIFGMRIGLRQWIGLGFTALGLMLLGVTLPVVHGPHSSFSIHGMFWFEAGLIGAGMLLIMGSRFGAPQEHHGYMLGAAAGILFGVSDIAIKAISGLIGSAGITGLLTPWTLFCLVASVAAFYASAKGLQDGDALAVITVTGTAANVAGIVGGIIVFGDPLAGNPLLLAVECLAFVLIIAAAWLMPAPARVASAAVWC